MAGELTTRQVQVAARAGARQAVRLGRIADAFHPENRQLEFLTRSVQRIAIQLDSGINDPIIAETMTQTMQQLVQQILAQQQGQQPGQPPQQPGGLLQ